jgi:2-phosphoglycerate kinase
MSRAQHTSKSDRNPPALLILVGPKGSGKSHIGAVVERCLGVRFLRVEPIFLAHEDRPGAVVGIQRQLDLSLAQGRTVVIESTGAAPDYIRSLQNRYQRVRLLQVRASAQTCFRRFKDRDTSVHVPVSDDRFHEINDRAARADFDWDCVLNNEAGLPDDDIARLVASVL